MQILSQWNPTSRHTCYLVTNAILDFSTLFEYVPRRSRNFSKSSRQGRSCNMDCKFPLCVLSRAFEHECKWVKVWQSQVSISSPTNQAKNGWTRTECFMREVDGLEMSCYLSDRGDHNQIHYHVEWTRIFISITELLVVQRASKQACHSHRLVRIPVVLIRFRCFFIRVSEVWDGC